MLVNNAGNVGIGTTSPNGTLQLGHCITTAGASNGSIVFGANDGSSSNRQFKMGYDTSYFFVLGDYGYKDVLNTWTKQLLISYSAPANSLMINSSGYIGFGTSTPSSAIDQRTANSEVAHFLCSAGNANIWLGYQGAVRDTATILWRQIGTGSTANYLGIGAYGADNILNVVAAGTVGIGITNPIYPLSVVGTIQAISTTNDVMGLFSTTYGGYLHIGAWVQSGASSKHVVLQQLGGNVGIGITNPGYKLHVDGSIYATAGIYAPSMGASYYGGGDQRSVSNYFKPVSQPAGTFTVGFYGGAAAGGWADGISFNSYVDQTGGNQNLVLFQKNGIAMRIYQGGWQSTSAFSTYADVSFQAGSDIRLKENIQDVSDARGMIDVLRPKTFHFIKDEDKVLQIGFIAQEVRDYYPQFVTGTESETQFLSMEYGKMSPLAIAACKELYVENDALKARIDMLESRLAALEQLLK